ncbi:MAG: phosphate ABC transporter permease PstA [Christensenellales bacterium]|jgi:phosphate transport system permease protein
MKDRYTRPNLLKHPLSLILRVAVFAATAVTVGTLIFLVAYILVKGIPHLTGDLFAWEYTSDNVSVVPSIITTVYMIGLSLMIAAPLGIGCAIYLVEYAKRGNRLVKVIRLTTETLSGIPSIVYGLFGMLFFVTTLKWRYSLLSGAFTLAIMILPLIIRSTEEALKSVPDAFREASFGLGAGRLRTIFRVVLPSAVPGILAGVILAIGRIIGETAALIYTAGSATKLPASPMDSGRTLAIHMYVLSGEGLHIDQAYAAAVVLLVTIFLLNAAANLIAKKITLKT